ncbi:MAG: protein kinase [Woeseiaceae bacterium]
MTEFSRKLGEFFARSASFADLEEAADQVVRANEDIDHALNILDRHRADGRLPAVLYRALSDRLMGKVAPTDRERDSTSPLANSVDDGGEVTERLVTDGIQPVDAEDDRVLMQDQTSRLKSLIPDDLELGAEMTSPQADLTALLPGDDQHHAPADATVLMSEAPPSEATEMLPDATRPLAEKTNSRVTDQTVGLQSDAESTAPLSRSEATAPLERPTDATRGKDLEAASLEAPEIFADAGQAFSEASAETTDDDADAHQPESPTMPKLAPSSQGNEMPAEQQRGKPAPDDIAGYEKTQKVNSHVAPTVRIDQQDNAAPSYEKTKQIADVTRPDMQRAETMPIADVPYPDDAPQSAAEKTQLLSDVPPPTQMQQPAVGASSDDGTLPIGQVPRPEIEELAPTAPIDSGVFPSKAFPTGTASNWLNPEQWSQRHQGPLGPGMVLKQRFLIERQLGRGGMGVVFKARDKRKEEANDRDPYVAVKVLNDNYRDHPQALIALQREARKAQTLAHPNIITVYDFDRDGTTVYMTMELMRGEPLDLLLRRRKKENEDGVEVELARRIIKEMAEGLAYAHKHDIIHSDFKPGNVFLTKDERVKILDFGIARARVYSGPKEDTEQTLFDAGDFSSLTPGYAAWEMFQRADPHPSDDVYAMAITAYLLLTGRHPFDRKTAEEAVALGLVPEPIKHIARHEWAAIEHGLELKREDRTPDAATFLREFSGRRKAARWATAAIVVLAVLASFFAYRSFQEPGPAIAWSELTAVQQVTFRDFIDSGQAWLANDPPWIGGAYTDFAAAYDIHPRNPEAIAGLNAVADSLIALAASAETDTDRQRLLGDIETASSNEYLKEHRQLRDLRVDLASAGSTRR